MAYVSRKNPFRWWSICLHSVLILMIVVMHVKLSVAEMVLVGNRYTWIPSHDSLYTRSTPNNV